MPHVKDLLTTHAPFFQTISSSGSISSLAGGKIKIPIEDVAWSLANINRFNGHVGRYSVAQHSCLVSDILGGSFCGLMHDGPESITGDIQTPVKNALNLIGNGIWREFENGITKRFCYHWGVTFPYPQQVHEADALALRIEVACLMRPEAKAAFMKAGIEPLYGSEHTIHEVWSEDRAFTEFMERFDALGPTARRK